MLRRQRDQFVHTRPLRFVISPRGGYAAAFDKPRINASLMISYLRRRAARRSREQSIPLDERDFSPRTGQHIRRQITRYAAADYERVRRYISRQPRITLAARIVFLPDGIPSHIRILLPPLRENIHADRKRIKCPR